MRRTATFLLNIIKMLKIVDLKTEKQVRPLGIDVAAPAFSWRLEGGAGKQKSYRILVATKNSDIENNNPDMWDSGEVVSSESIGVLYGGKALCSHSRYYVCVKVTDIKGNKSETAGEWFETALFDEKDWLGKWVGIPVNFNGGTLLFRKNITVPSGKTVARARAYVCGLGYHEFFLNGKKVGDAVLEPSVTEYAERVEYSTYNIDNLNQGDNVIGVELGYGWYGSRKLLVQIYIEYTDGTLAEEHSGPANGWWVGGSPTLENGIYSGETYDARVEQVYPLNWATTAYEPAWDNGWMYTIYAPAPKGKLVSRSIEPIRECAEFKEVSRTDMGNGVYVCDIGANIAGWVKIKVKGERGASVTLKFAEQLASDGYVNRINLRSAKCIDKYILKGEGTEEFSPRFTYHGFRFVQVEIEGKAELLEITGKHVHTDTAVVGQFECSDEMLNKMHYYALLTEHNNEHSILTDCPQRDERFGWLNDLGSRIYQSVYNVDLARFIPKFERDIADTQTSKGEIADTAPFYTGGVPADPVCIIFALLGVYAYRYYGDISVATENYDKIKAWVEYLKTRSDKYIMDYYYYGDWVLPYPETIVPDNLYVSTAYLYWHLKEMVKLAGIVGNEADVKKYKNELLCAKKAINEKYFDAKTCNYARGTQTENALAVSIGFCEDEYKEKVAENVYRNVIDMGHHCTSGNVGYRHVFYVLAEYGHVDEVIKILKNPEYPGWGFMMKSDARSVWERWEYTMTNEMHSFNHPMFGSYDAFFYKFLAGIDVDEDAFGANKLTVAPVFADGIDYVNCSYKTVRGALKTEWRRNGGRVIVKVSVPPQTEVKVVLNGNEEVLSFGEYEFTVEN